MLHSHFVAPRLVQSYTSYFIIMLFVHVQVGYWWSDPTCLYQLDLLTSPRSLAFICALFISLKKRGKLNHNVTITLAFKSLKIILCSRKNIPYRKGLSVIIYLFVWNRSFKLVALSRQLMPLIHKSSLSTSPSSDSLGPFIYSPIQNRNGKEKKLKPRVGKSNFLAS